MLYLFLSITHKNNNIFVPLRSDIGSIKNKNICYCVPSNKRPNAGLDYRKMLIVNDFNYIEFPTGDRITTKQKDIITNNYKSMA